MLIVRDPHATDRSRQGRLKRAAVAALLLAACVVLSACYMEPDRVVDSNNGLTVGDGGQTFDTVVTPTPSVTPTPTPAPTSNEVDWSAWDFGNDTATNPPSNVSPTSGVISGATSAPQIGTATLPPTTPPTQAPSTTATPSTTSSSSSTLKVGSTGSDVKRLQQRLKDLGYLSGSVDGDFGAATEQAVRDFQAANGLSVDGKAGTRTIEKLYSSSAKKKTATTKTAAPSSSSGSSSSSSSSSTSSSYTNGKTDIYLELGDTGSQVKILQNRLIVLGYLSGTADGEFAETTQAAVIAFQERNSIYADGIAGPTTLTKLYSSSAKKASSVVGHLGSLREGATGSAVRSLQQNLKTLGYYTGSVDGDYGTGTTAAVTAFQQSAGLKADGIAGKATLNAIYSALNGGSSGGSSSGSSSSPANYGKTASSNGYTTITTGSSSTNVTALQSALQATGYYSGSVDGSYGSGTEAAVEAYQRAAGLRVTGMAGPTTQRLLYGGTSESGSYSKLRVGSTGSAVKRLQYALYELKYYDGDISGTFDTVTENAVMLFQELNGLEIDGVAGQQTQQKLFSSNAVPCSI